MCMWCARGCAESRVVRLVYARAMARGMRYLMSHEKLGGAYELAGLMQGPLVYAFKLTSYD